MFVEILLAAESRLLRSSTAISTKDPPKMAESKLSLTREVNERLNEFLTKFERIFVLFGQSSTRIVPS